MSKRISEFRFEPFGLFIELEEQNGRVGVDLASGDILLDEGIGEDRYHGAVISACDFRSFSITPAGANDVCLTIRFGRGDDAHNLGTTTDLETAKEWAATAEVAIRRARERQRPVVSAYQPKAVSVENFSDSGSLRARNR